MTPTYQITRIPTFLWVGKTVIIKIEDSSCNEGELHNFRVRSVLIIQMVFATAGTLGFWWFGGGISAKSAILGGVIAWFPSVYYAWRSARSRSGDARLLVKSHYRAEAGKLALTAILFGVTFTQLQPVEVVPLFGTYILTLSSYWVALVIVS